MICPNCGQEIKDNAAFCEHCGSKIAPSYTSKAEVQTDDDYAAINRELQTKLEKKIESGTPSPVPEKKVTGKAPLVLGIIGTVLPPVGIVLGIIGLILGLTRINKVDEGKGKCITGIILSGTAILISLIVIIAISSGGGSKDKADKSDAVKQASEETVDDTIDEGSNPEAENETESEEVIAAGDKTEIYVGDVLDADGMKMVYVSSGNFETDNEFLKPADGNKYIYIELACENTSDSDKSISYFSFECYADGYNANGYYGEDDLLSATLSSGRTATGRVYFEVPDSAQEIEIEYEYNVWSDKKVKFIFEGDKDSGYVAQTNANASSDAYKVGDVLEGDNLKLTYVSCEPYISDNMFVEPKDGCEFITLSFEVENVSSSDKHISCYDFKCYADGKACDATYIRDDLLSADLSAGRKAEGTVTYEVPVDAVVVEVEYETNYWTSSHVVFTVR